MLDELSPDEYKKHSELFAEDLYESISLETCVNKRISEGGTCVESVEAQIEAVRNFLK